MTFKFNVKFRGFHYVNVANFVKCHDAYYPCRVCYPTCNVTDIMIDPAYYARNETLDGSVEFCSHFNMFLTRWNTR
jgi:hypothetical protein